MEHIYIIYITYVELLEPLLAMEVFALAENHGAVCVNGNHGIAIAVDQSDSLILPDVAVDVDRPSGIEVKVFIS